MNPPTPLEAFFFRRIDARGFGLMRVSWALVAGSFFLMQWKDVEYYYSSAGIITDRNVQLFMRSTHRFTVFEWVQSPEAIFSIYLFMLLAMFCMMIGLWPRLTTTLSVLLLFSFHERNQMLLSGGDTLLRNVGFILMISPGIGSFSFSQLCIRRRLSNGLPAVDMPLWPWRLLLWQVIVLYGTSLWHKLQGTMWLDGTALEIPFHHPVFARWPVPVMNMFMPFVGVVDYLVLIWHGAWLLLLVPRSLTDRLSEHVPLIPLRRLLIVTGLLFHGAILLLLDAGVFSLSIFVAYMGLMREEDLDWLRGDGVFRRRWSRH